MTNFVKDGFIINLNGLTRKDYIAWRLGRAAAEDKDTFDAEHLLAKVIIEWPYEQPVSLEGYLSLGFADSLIVDNMVSEAVDNLTGKE